MSSFLKRHFFTNDPRIHSLCLIGFELLVYCGSCFRTRSTLCAWKWWIIVSNTLIWRCLVLSNIVLTFLWLRHCQQLWCIFLSCYFFFVSYVISAADSCFQLDTSVLITRMRLLASLAAHRCANLHTCTVHLHVAACSIAAMLRISTVAV